MTRKLLDIRNEMPRHPTRKWKTRYSADRIIVHTSASNNQDPIRTANYHITPGNQNHISKKGCPGLCYHDFITKTGIVYHCNNYTDVTWHAGAYNKRSIGVVMAFRGQNPNNFPTEAQSLALRQHLVILCLYMKILPKKIIGHREVPGMWTLLGNGSRKYKKTCPGLAVNLDSLRSDVTERLQIRLSAEGLYTGPIDGLFGRKSKAALQQFDPLQASQLNWRSKRIYYGF